MTPEIVFLSVYPCPCCGAQLQAREAPIAEWLRCPRCGRASLSPKNGVVRRRRLIPDRPHTAGMSGADLFLLDDGTPRPRAGPRAAAVIAAVVAPVVIAKALGAETIEALLLGIIMAVALAFLIRPKPSPR